MFFISLACLRLSISFFGNKRRWEKSFYATSQPSLTPLSLSTNSLPRFRKRTNECQGSKMSACSEPREAMSSRRGCHGNGAKISLGRITASPTPQTRFQFFFFFFSFHNSPFNMLGWFCACLRTFPVNKGTLPRRKSSIIRFWANLSSFFSHSISKTIFSFFVPSAKRLRSSV